MDAAETMRRYPQWRLDEHVRVMFQEATGIAAAARANAAHRRVATELGATIAGGQQVTSITDVGGEYEIGTAAGDTWRAERLIVTSDAWTNEVLANFDAHINLDVTQEQVAYYASPDQGLRAARPVPHVDLDGAALVLRAARLRPGGSEDRVGRRRRRSSPATRARSSRTRTTRPRSTASCRSTCRARSARTSP